MRMIYFGWFFFSSNAFPVTLFFCDFHRTPSFSQRSTNHRKMTNRMKHMFVLLALVFALAHSNRADDSHVPVSATQATPSSTPAPPEADQAQHPIEPVKAAPTTAAAVNAINETVRVFKINTMN